MANSTEEDGEGMNEKALRKASRQELLELLLESTKEKERLLADMEAMRKEVAETRAKMQEYTVAVEEAGSIADAAAQVSGVFNAAQKTADIYLANIRRRQEEQEEACKKKQVESERLAAEIIAKAEKQCAQMELETKKRCEELYRTAEQDANRRWDEMSKQLEQLRDKTSQVETLLTEKPKRRWKR